MYTLCTVKRDAADECLAELALYIGVIYSAASDTPPRCSNMLENSSRTQAYNRVKRMRMYLA